MADDDDYFGLDEELLNRLVFSTFGDQRYTQDSPIMPDVWTAFARTPGARIDLLLTPKMGDSASQLAAMLNDRLESFEHQDAYESRLRSLPLGELVRSLENPPGYDARAEFEIAYSRSSLVARVDFRHLIGVIMPMTEWWRKLGLSAGAVDDFKRRLNALDGDTRELARLIAETDVIVNRSAWDFVRFGALAGFIELKRKVEEEARKSAIVPGSAGHDDRKSKLEKLAARLADGNTKISQVRDIIDSYWEVAEDVLDYEDKPESPRIFMITENRKASLAIAESRGTIKADAANNVFRIDTSDLAWAVIDGGIDARHPAFLDLRSVTRELAAPGATATASVMQDQDIPLDRLAKYSRVRETYDFTYLRRMLSRKDLPGPEDGGPPPAIAAYLRSTFKTQLDSLKVRTVLARDIDWDIVRPLIRVPHDQLYVKPRLGHGTHVAGILGGQWLGKDNPEGIDLVGICPEIGIYDLRVYKPEADNDEFAVQYALQFVEYLNRHREVPLIHGVNLSLSLTHKVMSFACGRTPVCDESNHLVSTGVVVVVAAGNDGYKTFKTNQGDYGGYHTASITDPGNAEEVITVGSTHRSQPHSYGVSYFSSRGPTGDGRRKPDLVAPGEKITAPVLDCRVQRMDGTSMAAPHVSGAAALLMARHRELIRHPRRIKDILCRTATDLGREPQFQGAGMVDILRALQSV